MKTIEIKVNRIDTKKKSKITFKHSKFELKENTHGSGITIKNS